MTITEYLYKVLRYARTHVGSAVVWDADSNIVAAVVQCEPRVRAEQLYTELSGEVDAHHARTHGDRECQSCGAPLW